MQLDDELGREIYEWKKLRLNAKNWQERKGIQFARKFQIKWLFWEENNCSETTQ
jgi:hypothetical protein